jgi:hypothetical protein
MPEPPVQEPEWFKKFKEANSKPAEPSAPRPGDHA